MIANNAPARPLPRGWRWVGLGDVCEVNPRRPAGLARDRSAPTSFVPMSAVDERSGAIVHLETRPFVEVSKGYTYFEEGDVLFAKITPCMQNGKHAIARGLVGGFGFGSTEFHVLRPSVDVTPDWIHRFLRQPAVLADAATHFTGAVGQQRVPPEYLASLDLPLPPLSEQRRIAAILDKQMAAVERARAAAEAQLAAAKALPGAYLRAVFESKAARGWPRKRLGEMGKIVSGVTLGRKLNGVGTRSVPYLRVANVKDGRLDLSDVYQIEATEDEIRKLRLMFGDLLLTEGGDPDKLGRGTFWEEQIAECIHQNHIFRVRLDPSEVLPQFVSAQIGSPYGKDYFLAHAKRTTGIATINQKVLSRFPLLVPSLNEQRQVMTTLIERLASAHAVRLSAEEQCEGIDTLPSAFLRCAFGGDNWA